MDVLGPEDQPHLGTRLRPQEVDRAVLLGRVANDLLILLLTHVGLRRLEFLGGGIHLPQHAVEFRIGSGSL